MCSASNSGVRGGGRRSDRRRSVLLRHGLEDRPPQLVEPGAGRRRDGEDAERPIAEALAPLRDRLLGLVVGHQVALRQHDQLGQPVEPGAVLAKLAADRLRAPPAGSSPGEVDQVDEHPAALDVGEELVPEAGALRGALDQARDVGEHELALVGVERPEHRLERS